MNTPTQQQFFALLSAAYDLKTFREGTPSYEDAEKTVNEFYAKYRDMINRSGWVNPVEFYKLIPNIPASTPVLYDKDGTIKHTVVSLIPISRLLDGTYKRLKVLV